MRRRGRWKAFVGSIVVAAAVLVPVAPAGACACGGVAPSPGSDVAVGEERAIVSWRDGVEQIDLLLGMLTSDTETGLVFPTPSPATVSLGERADFEAIERVTTPRRVEEYDWWSPGSAGDGGGVGAPPTVLDVVQLGPVEAVTLAASDSTGLSSWLAENDFVLSPEVSQLLAGYVDRGWYFVALRLSGDAPLEGGLDPLRFRFETDELIYPLELSRAATIPQTVQLFVFADHRQVAGFVGAGTPSASFVSWAAPVRGTEVEHFGEYLTVLQLYFDDPASQVLGDLEFADALSDETTGTEYHVTVPVEVAGMPLGWLIVFAAGAAVVGAFAVASRWRGARLP